MANSQELMLKIRGDNTDAERKIDQTQKSLTGFKLTAEKTSSAMRSFGQDLLNVRDASDLASIATKALGVAIAGSLGGTAIIAAGRALFDSYNKVQKAAEESEKAISAVRKSAEQIGAGEGLQATAGAAKALFAESDKVSEKLKEIESNKLKNFIAGITGAKEKMSELVSETQKQAKALERQGIVNTLIDMERSKSLSDADKAVRQIAEKYQPIIDAARATGDAELLNRTILQAQAEQVDVIKKAKEAEAASEKKIADARAKADADSATQNEINENRRIRNLERERAEIEKQVKINEERLRQEQTMSDVAEARLRFERSGGVYSGKGRATRFSTAQRNQEAMQVGGGILTSTREGRQALDVARKQRQRKVSREDFQFQRDALGEEAARLSKIEGKTLTRQDVRKRMAKQIAEAEMPTLEEKSGGKKSIEASLARLVSLMEVAPLVTSGDGKN